MTTRTQIVSSFYDEVAKIGDGTFGWKWKRKQDYPITRPVNTDCPCFYIFDYQEKVIDESKSINELIKRQLIIVLEFYIVHTLSDSPSKELDKILLPIENNFQANRLNGLVMKLSELGSKKRVESFEQRMVAAQMLYQADYVTKLRQ